jgi:hypothetical protein
MCGQEFLVALGVCYLPCRMRVTVLPSPCAGEGQWDTNMNHGAQGITPKDTSTW